VQTKRVGSHLPLKDLCNIGGRGATSADAKTMDIVLRMAGDRWSYLRFEDHPVRFTRYGKRRTGKILIHSDRHDAPRWRVTHELKCGESELSDRGMTLGMRPIGHPRTSGACRIFRFFGAALASDRTHADVR